MSTRSAPASVRAGARVSNIVNELGGEKIDIVEYSDDITKFIASALSPANVLSVEPAADGSHACRVTVPDNQLPAIGNKGQNARLAAKLTGWKIDIAGKRLLWRDGVNQETTG